jgi:hypothetical protein
MNAIVIISYTGPYGWNAVLECYNSIRILDKDIKIIIVNNFNDVIHPLIEVDAHCRYIINSENTYELGAIQTAVSLCEDVENFLIIHDSCIIRHKIPVFSKNTIFWKTTIMDIAPVMNILDEWCSSYFPDIRYDSTSYMCQGLMGYFSKKLLQSLFASGLRHIKVSRKLEAVASEGLFGILLHHTDPEIESYYNYKLDDYITRKQEYSAIVKKVGSKDGTNRTHNIDLHINNSSADVNCNFTFRYKNTLYNSLKDCFVQNIGDSRTFILFEYLSQNKDALHFLTQHFPCNFKMYNDEFGLKHILESNKHNLFVLRYFSFNDAIKRI